MKRAYDRLQSSSTSGVIYIIGRSVSVGHFSFIYWGPSSYLNDLFKYMWSHTNSIWALPYPTLCICPIFWVLLYPTLCICPILRALLYPIICICPILWVLLLPTLCICPILWSLLLPTLCIYVQFSGHYFIHLSAGSPFQYMYGSYAS